MDDGIGIIFEYLQSAGFNVELIDGRIKLNGGLTAIKKGTVKMQPCGAFDLVRPGCDIALRNGKIAIAYMTEKKEKSNIVSAKWQVTSEVEIPEVTLELKIDIVDLHPESGLDKLKDRLEGFRCQL